MIDSSVMPLTIPYVLKKTAVWQFKIPFTFNVLQFWLQVAHLYPGFIWFYQNPFSLFFQMIQPTMFYFMRRIHIMKGGMTTEITSKFKVNRRTIY